MVPNRCSKGSNLCSIALEFEEGRGVRLPSLSPLSKPLILGSWTVTPGSWHTKILGDYSILCRERVTATCSVWMSFVPGIVIRTNQLSVSWYCRLGSNLSHPRPSLRREEPPRDRRIASCSSQLATFIDLSNSVVALNNAMEQWSYSNCDGSYFIAMRFKAAL